MHKTDNKMHSYYWCIGLRLLVSMAHACQGGYRALMCKCTIIMFDIVITAG